ncbi:Cd(II)/Pb(II)-responsive transcriptional regulator [Usitatibacter palustris]|uniref:HTH-type transcriptional regulator ZntR n=1 Tax=Usitatibacter palustris TaxID=2732487 RepID=A0A6M4HAU4_9PROT|nr:Cd(II)/Pb(II)-responsive transcriptional regulator [Usitatibacter palustris]QJR16681.1 HTH-type transcriptional regulator ZntR [Usitatibacter palustris]
MKIGELAKAGQCDVQTIRYYEKKGLLPATSRTDANYRRYGPGHAERLTFIRHCRSLDMTLEEIRALLSFRDKPEANCGGVNELLDEHLQHVAHRIAQLTELEKELKLLRRQCRKAQPTKSCGILAGIATGTAKRPVSGKGL